MHLSQSASVQIEFSRELSVDFRSNCCLVTQCQGTHISTNNENIEDCTYKQKLYNTVCIEWMINLQSYHCFNNDRNDSMGSIEWEKKQTNNDQMCYRWNVNEKRELTLNELNIVWEKEVN